MRGAYRFELISLPKTVLENKMRTFVGHNRCKLGLTIKTGQHTQVKIDTTMGQTISINNRRIEGDYSSGQLIIDSTIYDSAGRPQTFERIVWQSKIDADANGLILYRAHSGYAMEDGILDAPKEKYERELFIPICKGLTHFSVQAVQGKTLLDKWTKEELPMALTITLSFAKPVENLFGKYEVPKEKMVQRTIAVDRTKQISYVFVKQEFILPTDEETEPNDIKKEADEIRNVPER